MRRLRPALFTGLAVAVVPAFEQDAAYRREIHEYPVAEGKYGGQRQLQVQLVAQRGQRDCDGAVPDKTGHEEPDIKPVLQVSRQGANDGVDGCQDADGDIG